MNKNLSNSKKSRKIKNKKRKLNYKRVFSLLFIILIIVSALYFFFNVKVTNIYISGNSVLSDQKIIEIARLQNYPGAFSNLSNMIENRLEKNSQVLSAEVSKRNFTEVYIKVKENRAVFYNSSSKETVLLKGTTAEKLQAPVLINYVPDTIYSEFNKKIKSIDESILNKVSEIKYDPNDVDDNRFLFMMNDRNYVYLTLHKLSVINDYTNIVKKFDNKKGILYLDYGNSFEILEE